MMEPPVIQLTSHKAMRGEWIDPEDHSPHRRVAKTINHYRRWCPLRRAMRIAGGNGDNCSYSVEHIAAADHLRMLADSITIGLSGQKNRFNLEYSDKMFERRDTPTRSEVRQARAIAPFRATMGLLSEAERELLTEVVLMNTSVQRICSARKAVGA